MAWLDGWSNRLECVIDHTRIDTDLTNFPVLLTLSSGSGLTNFDATVVFDDLSVSGSEYKIAVTDSSGNNQLYVEIEFWDLAGEEAHLWTKVPTVSSGTDTKLYLYYDSTHVNNTLFVGYATSSPASQVWDSNYLQVIHMSQNPSISNILDSTINGTYASPIGMSSSDLVNKRSIYFDGTNNYLDLRVKQITTNITVECVCKRAADNTNFFIFDCERENVLWPAYYLRIAAIDNKPRFVFYTATSVKKEIVSSVVVGTDYNYIAGIYNYSTLKVMVDGTVNSISETTTPNNINHNYWMGALDGSPTVTYYNGYTSEYRLSNTVRSEAWLNATRYSVFDDLITINPPIVFTASGTVYVDSYLMNGIPVRLYRRSGGQLVGETTTASGGSFEIDTPYDEDHYVVALYTTSGTNALIYDFIQP
jgi:hypothetical protein